MKNIRIITLSFLFIFMCTNTPLRGDFFKDLSKSLKKLSNLKEKLENISKEIQPKKETPKEIVKLENMSITIEYPFLNCKYP